MNNCCKPFTLKYIYIPLCLYLYANNVLYFVSFYLFTFHYVYIYISSGKSVYSTCFIYIPLCLYLYIFTIITTNIN